MGVNENLWLHSSQNSFLLYLGRNQFDLLLFGQSNLPEPLNEAVLVDEFDGASADTGMKEGPL